MKHLALVVFLLALLGGSGCAALIARTDWNTSRRLNPGYFAGVRFEGELITSAFCDDPEELIGLPLYLIDGIFSFIADILFIPSDFMVKRECRQYAEELQNNHKEGTGE